MAKDKKKEEKKVIVAEFKVSMHCNACERSVAKAISKFKGLEKFTTDMNKHKVTITGKIDPQKIVKKLRKKTGKKVEILVTEKPKEEEKEDTSNSKDTNSENPKASANSLLPLGYCWFIDNEALLMFNDENPNACSIM